MTQAVPYRGANETQDPENGAGARLYDMEAAAVYQAGAYYFGPHQMTFLKVVTDHGVAGNGKTGQPEQIGQKIARRRRRSAAYIDRPAPDHRGSSGRMRMRGETGRRGDRYPASDRRPARFKDDGGHGTAAYPLLDAFRDRLPDGA